MQFLLQKKGGKKGCDVRGKVLVGKVKAFSLQSLQFSWNQIEIKKKLEKYFEKKTGFYM
jgi:hypothetical protein